MRAHPVSSEMLGKGRLEMFDEFEANSMRKLGGKDSNGVKKMFTR